MKSSTDKSKPTGRSQPLDQHTPRRLAWLGALTVLLVIAATMALALYQFVPPAVVPSEAPATEFSAQRAMPHLRAIAREPHPVGSSENARVRDYLIEQISDMGLRPEVQKTAVFEPDEADATTVKNVLVRVVGTQPTSRAVLVTAHYDSVVTGPGAGDNGMSVAAMLETLQALQAGPPPRNDLIFLFNDGEEEGVIGSTAFVEQHPWAKDVGVVFDFDRGEATGAAILEWTAPHDGWLVQEISAASPGLIAPSGPDNPDKRQEYGNDLHAFAAAGLTGAHFGNIGGSTRYHTQQDNLASADPRALQDEGDAMLALTRHFGSLPIGETKAEDEVFFTLFGGGIVHYPLAWALPLGLLAGLGTASVIALGLWRDRLRVRALAGALTVLGVVMLAAAGAAHLAGQLLLVTHPESWVFDEGDFYGQGFYMGAMYAFTVALALAMWSWLGRRLEAAYLAVAALFCLGLLAAFYAIASPTDSFLLAWPALVGALALGVFVGLPGDGSWRAWARGAALLVASLVALGFLTPGLYNATLDGFEESPADNFLALVVLLGLLAPQLALVARAIRQRWLPAAATLLAALIGVGLLLAGNAASGYDASHPRPDSLFYGLNADTGEASWATLDPQPDQWTKRFLSENPEGSTLEEFVSGGGSTRILTSSAPVAPLKPPELELLGQKANGATRTLRLHLSSPRGAWRAAILPGPGVEVLALGVNGKPPQEVGDEAISYTALPPEGVDLQVKVRAEGPVRFTVFDKTNRLPRIPGVTLPKKPESVMPAPLPAEAEVFAGYPAFVSKSFVFGKGREAPHVQPEGG
jgi:hypothetical protein